jgi:hypothetical protein
LTEEAAIEAAQEGSAVLHLRDILKIEHDEMLKGRPRDAALKKRMLEIAETRLKDFQASLGAPARKGKSGVLRNSSNSNLFSTPKTEHRCRRSKCTKGDSNKYLIQAT